MQERHAVTGAFGYSGKRIAQRLLDAGHAVMTLTHSPHKPNPFRGRIEVHPFHFDEPTTLAESLAGVSVLYNTYWVRFNHKAFTFAQAVENSKTLFAAAKAAGVRRVVHVSITNPSADSPLEYFSGKAEAERALIESGLSHAILRPAVLFGGEDILVNNIAWMLRHLPVFGVPGHGEYRLQPIHVDDFARLAVEQGARDADAVVDAIGPETFTYIELVKTIRSALGVFRPILHVPAKAAYWGACALGPVLGDVVLTWDEIVGLMEGRLCVDSPPAGATKLSDWAREHAETLGRKYASELARRKQS